MIFAITVFAVAVYGFLIFFLLRKGTKAPAINLFLCLGFGIISGGVAFGSEYAWNFFLGNFISSHHSLVILESFIGVAFIEELSKWLWLVILIKNWSSFDRYTDGILFACAIAAGFNLLEGILYGIMGVDITGSIVRALTAIPVHFTFAVIMGFLFTRYKKESAHFLWYSLLIPVLLHGLYDFFIFQQYADLLTGVALIIFSGSLLLSVWVCRTALRVDRVSRAQ